MRKIGEKEDSKKAKKITKSAGQKAREKTTPMKEVQDELEPVKEKAKEAVESKFVGKGAGDTRMSAAEGQQELFFYDDKADGGLPLDDDASSCHSNRPDLVEGDTALLPQEFSEMTKVRSFITSWCPQQECCLMPQLEVSSHTADGILQRRAYAQGFPYFAGHAFRISK
ncbi:hypothetical protein ZIOFF_000715 [Zingiber officinale]|uniref:Uncharacterized protein n=1 Tax=Zingiber officinale TaxID=94328 RepID=A0A8J5HXP3_ZINOF|nr:hypothetical protein ZIOFF_000715 [Zingiber officinale]